VPWLVPGFCVEAYADTLLRPQSRLELEGRLVYEAKEHLIEARKPG